MARRRPLLTALLIACVTLVTVALASGPASASGAAASGPPLQLLAEPQAGNAPFLAMINGARHSIELTMYELYDSQIEHALAAAQKRGVDVQVLLNDGYYRQRETDNATAYSYLKANGVHVRYSPTYFALTHQKTLTVDGSQSAIMTLNFDGEYSSTRDFAVLDRQIADVRAIVATFDADWAGRQLTPSDGSGDLVWSPGAQATVLSMIDSARSSIELENEEMDYTPATDALCAAARRGVKVAIVMTYESDWAAALSRLSSCGASVRLYHGQSYYIHAKLLIVDNRAALVSSQNLSTGSLKHNRELGIKLSSQAMILQLLRDFAHDYAGGGSLS